MILKDLITDVLDVADNSEIGKFISKKNPSIKSITRANKDLTMTFPVMVSNTVDPASAQLVSRALERKFVTLTQMLLSAISITSSKDAIDHLKNVHSNLDLSSLFDVDDYLAISQEATANHIFDAAEIKAVYEAFRQERLHAKPINHLCESLMDDMMARMRQDPKFNANVADARFNNLSDDDKARAVNLLNTDTATRNRDLTRQNRSLTQQLNDIERNEGRMRRNFTRTQSQSKKRINDLRQSNDNLQARLDDIRNNTRAGLTKLAKDQDYKKSNELQPTLLQIQFISTNDNNDPITVDAYVGIKTKIYCVDSADIANHIVSKRSYNFSLYNLIKATSGEIEFWRDFVFAIKKAKIDAVSNTHRGSSSKLWKVLERRALASKINRFMSARNDATAITTLMMSAYDVEMLRKMEDIDISDSRVARKLMDDYNLVGIVIVDDSTESAKIIFDTGDDEYEPYTFKTLKRDDKMDYKQMIQLLAGGK
jgi:hypothetical protein|nr:MAG TPA: hypothetical protein [Caudoviricetes sp.]